MSRSLRRFSIHLMLEGGHVQVVGFRRLEDFQSWYGGVLAPAAPEADPTATAAAAASLAAPASAAPVARAYTSATSRSRR
jgi:hypothetical protein